MTIGSSQNNLILMIFMISSSARNDSTSLLRRNFSGQTKVAIESDFWMQLLPQIGQRVKAVATSASARWGNKLRVLLTYLLLDYRPSQSGLDYLFGNELQLGDDSVSFDSPRRDAKSGSVEHNLGQIHLQIVGHRELNTLAI